MVSTNKSVTQLLAITCGLLVGMIAPIAYGMEEYGAFLRTCILSLLIHRVIDLYIEPLLANVAPEKISDKWYELRHKQDFFDSLGKEIDHQLRNMNKLIENYN